MSHDEEKLMSGEAWREFCDRLKGAGETILGKEFPQDPNEQLWGAIGAVTPSIPCCTATKNRITNGVVPILTTRMFEPRLTLNTAIGSGAT